MPKIKASDLLRRTNRHHRGIEIVKIPSTVQEFIDIEVTLLNFVTTRQSWRNLWLAILLDHILTRHDGKRDNPRRLWEINREKMIGQRIPFTVPPPSEDPRSREGGSPEENQEDLSWIDLI